MCGAKKEKTDAEIVAMVRCYFISWSLKHTAGESYFIEHSKERGEN